MRPNLSIKCEFAATGSSSAAELTNVEAKPIFDVSSAMEATFHQRLDPLSAGRDRRDDLVQLQRLLRAKDVYRRKVERDSPI